MSDEDEYGEEQQEQVFVMGPPCWPFSLADIIGVGFVTLAGIFTALQAGATMLAQEFFAAATFGRVRKAERLRADEHAKAAREFEQYIGWPGSGKGGQS